MREVYVETVFEEAEGNTREQGEALFCFRFRKPNKGSQGKAFRSILTRFRQLETARQQVSAMLGCAFMHHFLDRTSLAALEQYLTPYTLEVAARAMQRGSKRIVVSVHVLLAEGSASMPLLETVTYGAGDAVVREDKCPICLEDFERGVELVKTPCTHVFHRSCVGEWLERSSLCPYCRSEIRKELLISSDVSSDAFLVEQS